MDRHSDSPERCPIAQMLGQRGISGHVATLFPIAVIDANRVLPEFAAGPFFFRSADAYSAEQVAQLHGGGPATLRPCSLSRHPRRSWPDSVPFPSSGTRPWTLR